MLQQPGSSASSDRAAEARVAAARETDLAPEAATTLRQELADTRWALEKAQRELELARKALRREEERRQTLSRANRLLDRELFKTALVHGVYAAAEGATDLSEFCEALFDFVSRVVKVRYVGLRLCGGGCFEFPEPLNEGQRRLAALYDATSRGPESDETGVFSFVFSRQGAPFGGLVCLLEDDTELSETEHELLTTICEQAGPLLDRNVLLKQLQELDSFKEDFVTMLSHDLRNPLTGVISALGVATLASAELDPAEREQLIGNALTSAKLINAMIDDLLDVAKLEAGRLEVSREPVEWIGLVREALVMQAPFAQARRLELAFAEPGELPHAWGERKKLTRVLINLIANALKYTQRGGVTLELAAVEGGVQLTISDTGFGVPEEAQGRLFEKFYQVAERKRAGFGGTGLGLAFCRQMVEAHGGRIWMESPSRRALDSGLLQHAPADLTDAGSSFHVVLPLKPR